VLRISDTALEKLGQNAVQPCPKKGLTPAARRKATLARRRKDAEQARKDAISMLNKALAALDKWDDDTKEKAKTWFGDDSEEVRKTMRKRTSKAIRHLEGMSEKNFELANKEYAKVYAYVYPDKDDKIYLGNAFDTAPATGDNSKAGTLVHETSHFDSVGGTQDVDYGHEDSQKLAETDPTKAQNNADSYEYFVEDVASSTPSMRLP
jgi:peptidyl-Lys metalloendopeptidase